MHMNWRCSGRREGREEVDSAGSDRRDGQMMQLMLLPVAFHPAIHVVENLSGETAVSET